MVEGWEGSATGDFGALHITSYEGLSRARPDRPILERQAPKQASDSLIVEAIFGYYKPIPFFTVLMGIFLFGDNDMEFAYIAFGGTEQWVERNGLEIEIGSMFPILEKARKGIPRRLRVSLDKVLSSKATGWNDGYIELKIVKEGSKLSAFYRRFPEGLVALVNDDGWLPVGGLR